MVDVCIQICMMYGVCMYAYMYGIWYMVYVSMYIWLVYVVCMSAYMSDSI